MDTPEYASENESEYDPELDDEEQPAEKILSKDKNSIKLNLGSNEDDEEVEEDDLLEDQEEDDDEIYDQTEDEDDEINIDDEDDEQENNYDNENLNIQDPNIVIDEEDSDDEYDENFYKKFDTELKENFILNRHSNLLQNNYDEIETLSKITNKNKYNIIDDEIHRTVPLLTKYEKARVLGIRAKQIENGSLPLIDIDASIIDSYLIAIKELEEKKIPFIIKRPLPNGSNEYWKLSDLEVIND